MCLIWIISLYIYFKLRDMYFFAVVMTITFISYGIGVQSLRQKKNTFSIQLIRDIIDIAYWPIYGEFRDLSCITRDDACDDKSYIDMNDTLNSFTYFLLFAYLLVILVLINLLIAMFK